MAIYKIVNKKNGKFYIGSTKNINIRWADHKRELNQNKHHCSRLQNSWNKHGEENFEFLVIEEIVCFKDLLKREQFYLDKLKPYNDIFGYNISPNACGGFRGVSIKGRKLNYNSKKAKPVNQFSLDGKLIKKWKSGRQIYNELGFSVYPILNPAPSAKWKVRSIKGYVWSYYDTPPKFYDKYHDDVIKKPIYQFSKSGKFIKKWKSIADAQKILGIKGIWNAANNYKGEKSCKGFIWRYSMKFQ